MCDQIWEQKAYHNDHNHDHDQKILIKSALVRVPFRIITTTLLSLLLPLSFFLLARIACAHFLKSQLPHHSSPNSPVFFSVFLHTNQPILHLIVSTISIATLVHTLTGKLSTLPTNESCYVWSPLTLPKRPYASWIFLLTLQVSIGFGYEGRTVALDNNFSSFSTDWTLYSIEVFLLGLHETMIHWSRLVVEPVVNDTIFGVVSINERWFQRGVMAGSFGSLWFWRLRNEVESLVVVGLAKREIMSSDVGLVDFAGWCLYYMTVMIGVVKVIKGLAWVVMSLFFRTRVNRLILSDEPCMEIEQKV